MKKRAFGRRLKMIRERVGLTQTALGHKTGISQNRISNWELGYAYPDVEHLVLLADGLGCSVDELVGYPHAGLSDYEYKLIEKIRRIDDDGMHTVEAVIDSQLLRLGCSMTEI
ncbi:MAG: helix-turn-helix transcriptional regulator [Clostridia bacterium]|nr:helix-turn-helix transcriptional regulator [Clostridia bacterium]